MMAAAPDRRVRAVTRRSDPRERTVLHDVAILLFRPMSRGLGRQFPLLPSSISRRRAVPNGSANCRRSEGVSVVVDDRKQVLDRILCQKSTGR